ncbi:sodium:proton antiporter [Diaminobutyricibacter tongyongensis]|uniref:Sodium:proton antiporter n=1 Tax=Leifsonia tongyongensis TaxID=1268043 RepID=A0A6L9Y061_9MICO|nr:sodium:proton antiporter [Diaminobutyricibacter tongyongensis]NEN06668.1 sodium:proton antiporter [Diaminobutyricibacter tongyongensis]
MEIALIAVVGVVTVVAVAAFSKQLGVAAPLVLVVVGVATSFLPGLPSSLQVPSWVILGLVLPPLLYSSAVQVQLTDFRRNLGTISMLSVVLVIATAFAVGFLLHALLPALDLGSAIALGAVVSPTDAVAATSVAKRLGLPTRLVAVLEGESLVNDASALVLLKAAIGATGAGLSLLAIGGDFLYSVVVAIGIGLLVGVINVWVRAKLKDSVLETAISFVVPFVAYIPTESLGASGVLAVVVAGIYTGHSAARSFSPQARLSEQINWRTIKFLLENGVFLLMGIQLHEIISKAQDSVLGAWGAFGIGLLLCVVLLVIRALFVFPIVWQLKENQKRAPEVSERLSDGLERVRTEREKRPPQDERTERRWNRFTRYLERREADVSDLQDSPIGWRGGVVITWAGMRGVVTVAAAQSLPDSAYRSPLILIAFTVAIVTLLVQGGTLPVLIRRLGITGSDAAADRRELAGLLEEMSKAGLAAIDHPDDEAPEARTYDPDVVERVRQDTMLRVEAQWERAEREESDTPVFGPHQQYQALKEQVLEAERNALLDARSRGSYSSRVLLHAQVMLDFEESRLSHRDNEV